MSPCSVYPGRLPASLWLASDSAHEEWPGSFRSWRKSLITPQRAGLVMLPLLPSPGGVENLFQTSISRDISNSLITSPGKQRGLFIHVGTRLGASRGKPQVPPLKSSLAPEGRHAGALARRLCPPGCALDVCLFRRLQGVALGFTFLSC